MGLKSFFNGLFGKGTTTTPTSDVLIDLINGRYVAGEVNTDQYLDYLSKESQKKLSYQSFGDSSKIVKTSASNIHDVDLFGSSREEFWNHHGHTKADYHELASHIPEVQKRLDAGESLSTIVKDPEIGKCAELYFEPNNMPRVSQYGDTYIAGGDNRHRILAAQEQGHEIPVKVVGEYTSIEQQVSVDDQEEETTVEEEVVVEEEMEVDVEIEVEAEAPATTENNCESQESDYDYYNYYGY